MLASPRVFANAFLCAVSILPLALTSCSTGLTNPASPTATTGAHGSGSLQGGVHGGQQPVTGSTIQLWAVGTTGTASASTPLLTQTVTTGQNGVFTINNLYTCPSATSLVYITATGGNPGLGGTANNSSLALLAALGTCGSLSSSTFVNIDEVTTIAAVTALAPFMTSLSHVGAASYPALVAAFRLANSLADTSTGISGGPALASGSIVPIPQLNSLANVIGSCINSAGGVSGDGTSCGTLFANAGGSTIKDTVAALLQIAANPTRNISNLFNLASAVGPFQPSLASAPATWAIQLTPGTAYTATPVITPGPIDVLPGQVLTVTITDASPGAVIHYSIDGDIARITSPVYTGPFLTSATLDGSVFAVAISPGHLLSNLAYGGIRLAGYVSSPVFSPAAGVVSPGQVVTITDDTPGVTIYYTLDGSAATTSSPVYTGGPITITGPVTIKLLLTAPNFSDNSAIATYTFAPSGPQPYIYTVAGGGTTHPCFPNAVPCPGYYGDPGPATTVSLFGVTSIAVDPAGNLYLANQRLLKVDASTGILRAVGPATPCPSVDPSAGDNGPVGLACFDTHLVATDHLGNIFITDDVSNPPGRVRRIDATTGIITEVAGVGPGGDGGPAINASFSPPSGLAIDPSGNLYISVSADNNVRRVDAVTGIITTVAGTGTPGFSGDNGPAAAAQLHQPGGIALNAAGDLYIADSLNGRVRKVDHTSGIITTIAGGSPSPFYDDGVPATSSFLKFPNSLAFDSTGNLFISDRASEASPLRKVDPSGIITSVAGQNGSSATTYGVNDGLPANLANIHSSQSISIGPDDNLYILNYDLVREIVFH